MKLKYLDKSYFDFYRYTGYLEIGIHVYLSNGEILNPDMFEFKGYRLGGDIDIKRKEDTFVVYAIMKCDSGDVEFWFHLFFDIDEDMEIAKKIGIPIEKYVTNQGV